MIGWADRRVMVTGGGGFLGKAVVKRVAETPFVVGLKKTVEWYEANVPRRRSEPTAIG